jgi:lipopolysaccharide/colanic/teichoic acid biosynthesis glycosyltransferase
MSAKNRSDRLRRGDPNGNHEPSPLAQHLAKIVQRAFYAVNGEQKGVAAGARLTSLPNQENRNSRVAEYRAPELCKQSDDVSNARATAAEREDPKMSQADATSVVGRFPNWKRWLDVTCILLTTPFWLPLMILAMLIIKIVSRGPVFFRQRRIGLGGTEFMILKFRSMHMNSETRTHESYVQQLMEADRPMTKLDESGDSRLIPGGRLLRATALDELPQIFNVLRGEMSLVGPRPCTPSEYERYQARHKMRCQFPPGLTGYWQVNGKNNTTFSEMIEMDLHYGERMSVFLDIMIMLKTFPALIEQVLESQSKRRLERSKVDCEQIPAYETIKERTN